MGRCTATYLYLVLRWANRCCINGGWGMRIVYYALANSPGANREGQWIQSVRSLRMYNQEIPVWLLLFNGATAELLHEADRLNVHLHFLGDYGEFMQRAHARGSVLALYPTFQKFVALTHVPSHDLSQLLYLDNDTFFFDD